MNNRTARFLIGILAICCIALVSSAVYPVSVSTTNAASPADERFTVGESPHYRATGSIVVNGERELRFKGVVTTDGERYQLLEEDGVRSEQYQPAPGDVVYQRITLESAAVADRMRTRIANDDDRVLLRENRTERDVMLIVKADGTNLSEDISGSASLFVRNLQVMGYHESGGGSAAHTVYEPRNGWYSGADEYRVAAASGEVRTESDSRVVRSANVSWEVTAPAGSYAEYALVGLLSAAPRTHRTTFDFREGDSGFERPSWVTNSTNQR